MAMEILKTFGNLQHELEKAKNSLKDVDENLKKLIGRDPSEIPQRNPLKRSFPDDKNKPKNVRLRNFTHENEEPLNKRRNNVSVFKRLSEKVEEPHQTPQKGMISKVIVTNKEIPSREQVLVAQSRDEKFKERNKRMFGALLGTLQKFQQEETKLKPREEKRAQVEKKIEEHEIKEKLEIKKERQELFLSRKKKQAEIKIIELKMLRMKEYAVWEENQKPRMSFITTKAKPHIHYLPRRVSSKTNELLEKSKKDIEEIIEKKKEQISSELQLIEDRMKRSFEFKYGPKLGNTVAIQPQDQEQEEHFDHEAVLTETQIAVEEQKEKEKKEETEENKVENCTKTNVEVIAKSARDITEENIGDSETNTVTEDGETEVKEELLVKTDIQMNNETVEEETINLEKNE